MTVGAGSMLMGLSRARTARAGHAPVPTHMLAAAPANSDVPAWAHGKVITDVAVPPGQKVFALTFDDGPWPHYTEQVLKVLEENHIKATFFMVGSALHDYARYGVMVRDAGHVIGNHSWSHPSHPKDPVGEITRTDAEIRKDLGISPTLFRPPYGLLKNGLAKQAAREHYPIVLWSCSGVGWQKPGAERIASLIVSQARPGGIALLHDGGGNRSQTVAALPIIIRELRQRGYRFVTIPQLLRMRSGNGAAGKKATLTVG